MILSYGSCLQQNTCGLVLPCDKQSEILTWSSSLHDRRRRAGVQSEVAVLHVLTQLLQPPSLQFEEHLHLVQ